MYAPIIPQILDKYSVSYKSIGDCQKGYRNESYRIEIDDGNDRNVICYKSEPGMMARINRADTAASVCANYGYPVRTRADERLLRLSSKDRESYAGMYAYLPGETIEWHAYTKKHIKLLGWTMSDMHAAWRKDKVDRSQYPSANELLQEQLTSARGYFLEADVAAAMQVKLSVRILEAMTQSLVQQLNIFQCTDQHVLHMDMVRSNILFGNRAARTPWVYGEVALSGVIDFEKVAIGHPVHDMARTLAFLYVDCTKYSQTDIRKMFIGSGYNKRGASCFDPFKRINGVEMARVLDDTVTAYLLYDFYKFLAHTPYESLESNHHYVRTRNILASRAVLKYPVTSSERGTIDADKLEKTTDITK